MCVIQKNTNPPSGAGLGFNVMFHMPGPITEDELLKKRWRANYIDTQCITQDCNLAVVDVSWLQPQESHVCLSHLDGILKTILLRFNLETDRHR